MTRVEYVSETITKQLYPMLVALLFCIPIWVHFDRLCYIVTIICNHVEIYFGIS